MGQRSPGQCGLPACVRRRQAAHGRSAWILDKQSWPSL